MADILETYSVFILIYAVVLTTVATAYLYFNKCKQKYSLIGPPYMYMRYKKYCTTALQLGLLIIMHMFIGTFVVYVAG